MKQNDRYFDLVPKLDGQVNVYVYKNKEFKGWHLHKKQTDNIYCVKGCLEVYEVDERFNMIFVFKVNEGKTHTINTNVWHGIKSLELGTTIIYYYNKKFNVKDTQELPKDHFKVYEYFKC